METICESSFFAFTGTGTGTGSGSPFDFHTSLRFLPRPPA